MTPRLRIAPFCLALTLVSVTPATGQQIRGRVLDSSSGAPVAIAAVFLLDAEREQVGAMVDTLRVRDLLIMRAATVNAHR